MIKAITIPLACVLSMASLAVFAHDGITSPAYGVHAQDSHHDTAAAPRGGQLWPTDEPLRSGMSRIEVAVAQATTAERPISRERARELARTVEENVAYIVEHCKLPPEPDAALHVLIARIVAAADLLRKDASSEAALTQLISALHDYRDTFDHSPAASPHRH